MPNYAQLLGTGDTVPPLSKAMGAGDEKRSQYMKVRHQLNRVMYKTQEATWATDCATAIIIELRTQEDKATWEQIKNALQTPLSVPALIRRYQPQIQAYLDSIGVITETHVTTKGYEVKTRDWSQASEQPKKSRATGPLFRPINMKEREDNEE